MRRFGTASGQRRALAAPLAAPLVVVPAPREIHRATPRVPPPPGRVVELVPVRARATPPARPRVRLVYVPASRELRAKALARPRPSFVPRVPTVRADEIARPIKSGGTRSYVDEVAHGFDIIRAAEVDADLDVLYAAAPIPGPAGPVGPAGTPGSTGPMGPEGPEGPAGTPGPAGEPGDPGGPMGPAGPVGPAGADSTVPGPPGPAGADGAQGPQGDPGPTGATGAASTVPGPPGATGAQGAPGPQGDPGPTGATGSQGPQGDTGATGTPGATGAQGPKGDTGTAGATGAQGPQGVKGDTGTTGAQGVPGTTGAQGPQGIKGDTGATGSQGPQGNPGATGTTGAQGTPGVGVPAGGAASQVLVKSSASDYATAWTTGDLNLASSEGTARAVTTFVNTTPANLGANITTTFTCAAFPVGTLRAGRIYRVRGNGAFQRSAGTLMLGVYLQNGGNQLGVATEVNIATGSFCLDLQLVADGAGGLTTTGHIITANRATGPAGVPSPSIYTVYNFYGAYGSMPGNSFSIGGAFSAANAANFMGLAGGSMEVL